MSSSYSDINLNIRELKWIISGKESSANILDAGSQLVFKQLALLLIKLIFQQSHGH